MAEYRKYMFDDLVVGIESKKTSEDDTLPSNEENKEIKKNFQLGSGLI